MDFKRCWWSSLYRAQKKKDEYMASLDGEASLISVVIFIVLAGVAQMIFNRMNQ